MQQVNRMCPESGHMSVTCRWCLYLNLSKISLSLSEALRIHIFEPFGAGLVPTRTRVKINDGRV